MHLKVLSLRYSSWSMRPWLALRIAGSEFDCETVELDDMGRPIASLEESGIRLARRRALGSVAGLFPVLHVEGVAIHESLAICEWAAEVHPEAGLWPEARLDRARARAISAEMASGFSNLRSKMSCHVFARVPRFAPDLATGAEIARVFEIWGRALESSGGPFLFGSIGIADCMYFPVLTRFRTYGVEIPADLEGYASAMEAHPAVEAWRRAARQAPAIPSYDDAIRAMGGTID
jgi:glutathione S-transferase